MSYTSKISLVSEDRMIHIPFFHEDRMKNERNTSEAYLMNWLHKETTTGE